MAMTSDELAEDLHQIDQLITVLSAPERVEHTDRDDLNWLMARRQMVSELIAVRRAQRGKKIVSLAIWRYGLATEEERMAGIA
jgi:hypothetical protein